MKTLDRLRYESVTNKYFVQPSPIEKAAREYQYQAFKARLLLELEVEVPDNTAEDPDSVVTGELVDHS